MQTRNRLLEQHMEIRRRMTRPINTKRILRIQPLSIPVRPLSKERRISVALVAAAKPHLNDLLQAVDRSGLHVVIAEFERAVSFVEKHQPDLIFVAAPPILDALKACERLLENGSTRDIPLFLVVLDYNAIDEPFITAPARSTAGEVLYLEIARSRKEECAADDTASTVDCKRQKRLLSVLDLLQYAEAEITELDLETSAVLLEATIADLVQHLE